jgi:hypothetical protein
MKYALIIDTDKLGEEPIIDIVNILQRQSEKLLRWKDATTWSDTLTDNAGKSVGTATLLSNEPESEDLTNLLEKYFPAPTVKGCTPYTWDGAAKCPLQCSLQVEPAEHGAKEDGVQLEPDHPAEVIILAASVRGINIVEMLDSNTVASIQLDAESDIAR